MSFDGTIPRKQFGTTEQIFRYNRVRRESYERRSIDFTFSPSKYSLDKLQTADRKLRIFLCYFYPKYIVQLRRRYITRCSRGVQNVQWRVCLDRLTRTRFRSIHHVVPIVLILRKSTLPDVSSLKHDASWPLYRDNLHSAV